MDQIPQVQSWAKYSEDEILIVLGGGGGEMFVIRKNQMIMDW
jgi:hypothetical protein